MAKLPGSSLHHTWSQWVCQERQEADQLGPVLEPCRRLERTRRNLDRHDSKHHRFKLPAGGRMQPDVPQKQEEIPKRILAPQSTQLVEKTTNRFVQAITDQAPPEDGTKVARLLTGEAVLVDALNGFRPH